MIIYKVYKDYGPVGGSIWRTKCMGHFQNIQLALQCVEGILLANPDVKFSKSEDENKWVSPDLSNPDIVIEEIKVV